MLQALGEGGETRQAVKLNGLSINVFLIKIVIFVLCRRVSLRTIALPEWRPKSSAALYPKPVRKGREEQRGDWGNWLFPLLGKVNQKGKKGMLLRDLPGDSPG